MNINDMEKAIQEYNTPEKLNYKHIKIKRIKTFNGSIRTQYYYKGYLILEK